MQFGGQLNRESFHFPQSASNLTTCFDNSGLLDCAQKMKLSCKRTQYGCVDMQKVDSTNKTLYFQQYSRGCQYCASHIGPLMSIYRQSRATSRHFLALQHVFTYNNFSTHALCLATKCDAKFLIKTPGIFKYNCFLPIQ